MAQFGELDSRDLVASFMPRFEATVDGSWASRLSIRVNSEKASESYGWLGGAPSPREWLGGRHEQTLKRYAYTLVNKTYEGTLAFYRQDLRRSQGELLRGKVEEMAMKAARWPEKLISDVINDNTLGYDGIALFSAAHPESGTNQKNLLTATEVPSANVAAPTAPTPAEMANVLVETIGYQYGITDDTGDTINGDAAEFTVMVATAPLFSAVTQAIRLNSLVAGADNPLQGLGNLTINPIYNPRLTSATDKVFIFRTDGGLKPFINQVEVELERQLLGAGSEEEFKHDRHLYGIYMSRAAGPGMWQHAMRVTLS